MKTIFLSLLAAGMLLSGCSQGNGSATASTTGNAESAPVMKFDKPIQDFGKIKIGDKVTNDFKFTNTGKEPLIIKDAHGSCGCTIPTWPKEPIQPGQENEIKVHYATDRVGRFQKTVTINSNANPNQVVIYIMGNVLPDDPNTKPATPAPTPVPVSGGK